MRKNILLLLLVIFLPSMAQAMVGAEPTLINGEEVVLLRTVSTDKYIKADSSDRVYLVKEQTRYWLYNQAMFHYYAGDDIVVDKIDGRDMNNFANGRDMFLPVGTLVKKIIGDKVYAVTAVGELTWLRSPAAVRATYGADWAARVQMIPDKYFEEYTLID
ncbi:MAG: hypothetical protein ACKKL5_02380 [Candidatus Komeilibacteria bacterium]